MARSGNKLSAVAISKLKKRGVYGDGHGLYLQVSEGGTKAWLFRFMQNGRARKMGLGPLHTVSLAEARDDALACRKQLREGIDPIEARKAKKAAVRAEEARQMTFRQCGAKYIEANKVGWKNAKHAAQWPSTLEAHVYPKLGDLPIDKIEVAHVMKVVEPLWTSRPETASRVRGRIETIIDWATARGYRKGENPARWKGHLQSLLPPRNKVASVKHLAALPYAELPSFMGRLRELPGIEGRALEFAILTAARSGEVIHARWPEIDLAARMWIIPPGRMKRHREHRVPLSDRALEILEGLAREGDFVFIGYRAGKPLSEGALLKTLERMGRTEITVHGMRSTFRDWASEQTAYPSEMCEMALAHAVSNKVEAAYRRGDMLEKRRRLMADWASYCASPAKPTSDKVVGLRAAS
jgi:integrase